MLIFHPVVLWVKPRDILSPIKRSESPRKNQHNRREKMSVISFFFVARKQVLVKTSIRFSFIMRRRSRPEIAGTQFMVESPPNSRHHRTVSWHDIVSLSSCFRLKFHVKLSFVVLSTRRIITNCFNFPVFNLFTQATVPQGQDRPNILIARNREDVRRQHHTSRRELDLNVTNDTDNIEETSPRIPPLNRSLRTPNATVTTPANTPPSRSTCDHEMRTQLLQLQQQITVLTDKIDNLHDSSRVTPNTSRRSENLPRDLVVSRPTLNLLIQ